MTIDELIRYVPVGAKILINGEPVEECSIEISEDIVSKYRGCPPIKISAVRDNPVINFISKVDDKVGIPP